MKLLKVFIRCSMSIMVLAAAPITAIAQDFPNRPIRIVVPFPPGGPADVLSRPLGEAVQRVLGQPVIVDFRPGAGAIVAVQNVLSSPADGYTVLMGSNVLALSMGLYKNIPYNTLRDLRGVITVTFSPYLMLVPASSPLVDVGTLIRTAKAQPGKLNFASSGPGTLAHVAAEMFNQSAGVKITHIPYKGAGPAITALMGGNEVQLFFDAVFSAQGHISGGKIKPIGVTALTRAPQYPNVPTVDEQGVKGFQVASWFGIVTHKSVPDAIVARLNHGFNEALKSQMVRDRYATIGAPPVGGTSQAFQKLMEDEVNTWTEVMRNSGISLN